MRDIPVGWRVRVRELSLGPIAWGSWQWTFMNGDTWIALAFEGDGVIGWSAVCDETDRLPVVAVFVDSEHRRRGLGELLVSSILRWCIVEGHLAPGAEVFASLGRWSKYPAVVESCGLRVRLWE